MPGKSGSIPFGFRCVSCGQWHSEVPSYHLAGPANFLAIPEPERAKRCMVDSDACVIDRAEFYVRALIEIPVRETDEPFVWGVWASLSEKSFRAWVDAITLSKRAHFGPFFGWLDTTVPFYPETRSLRTLIRLRDNLLRPAVELEPTDHPLAVEQWHGIGVDRVAEIVALAEARRPDEAQERPN